jgi:transketolase
VDLRLPSCEAGPQRCQLADAGKAVMEECFWDALLLVREALEQSRAAVDALAARLLASRARLDARGRRRREGAPRVEAVFELAAASPAAPAELRLAPGTVTTLRGELGRALQHFNARSGGALLTAAADLLGSTSVNVVGSGFPEGYWNAASNAGARLLSLGGICEDAMSGILAGLSTFGRHVGVGSSYGAFIAPLGHIASRLHAIGLQARRAATGQPYAPMVLVCAHAGLKTGEDGPTHADPQPLQLLQENFPRGTVITLTPWEPQEIWPLLAAAFARRPALIAPFVTRPNESVPDRKALGLAPPEDAVTGVYALRRARGRGDGVVVVQESAAAYAFLTQALPRLERDGFDPWVYGVTSAEMFDLLPREDQRRIFPEEHAQAAMGITGFTLPTLFRWVRSDQGREMSLHPYRKGHFLGSGQGEVVLEEAGLDGDSQYAAVRRYLEGRPAS